MSKQRGRFAGVVVCLFVVTAFVVVSSARADLCDGDPTAIKVGAANAVCGKVADNPSVYTYQGIPYAQPPVDALRWQPPQAAAWPPTPPLQAIDFGNECAQPGILVHAGDEDCLYLNVWTPREAINGARKLPVMVFIHGGAFFEGSGSKPTFEGSALASGGVVVVTLNYRLGALGFLVADKDGIEAQGNLGLLDQQLAMRWVANNIGPFGGDPARITLFGESAGAMSVGLHLFSVPSSQPLFAAAIMESNPLGVVYSAPADAKTAGNVFMDDLCRLYNWDHLLDKKPPPRCPKTGWLGHVTTQEIVHTQGKAGKAKPSFSPSLPWAPVIDGSLVTGQPYAGYAPAMTSRKPLGLGVNRNEGVLFAALDYLVDKSTFTQDEYGSTLEQLFGADLKKKILATPRYQPPTEWTATYYNNVAAAFANVVNDYVFSCGNVAAANAAASAAGAAPVFGYWFTQPPFFDPLGLGACKPSTGNVCHGNELAYVFDNLGAVTTSKYQPKISDIALAAAMSSAWIAFANNPTAPQGWLRYQPGAGSTRLAQWNGSDVTPVDLDTEANCSALWLLAKPYAH